MTSATDDRIRAPADVITAGRQLEGGGFPVRRPFPGADVDMVDPFLLLDEMGPVTWPPGEAIGAPDHPHRGFETVTYVLAGRMEHRDSRGHAAVLGPGDVQWMTAGAGVVHSELPEERFRREGGVMHGFQLWVNLPRRDKMMAPRYQTVHGDRIPRAESADGLVTARVIAGEALGETAIIDTRTPMAMAHYTIAPGGRVVHAVPPEHRGFVYVWGGAAEVGRGGGARPVESGQMAILADDGDATAIACPPGHTGPAELLMLSGVPLREPVARYGPFVMCTRGEILQALSDYQSGKMGAID